VDRDTEAWKNSPDPWPDDVGLYRSDEQGGARIATYPRRIEGLARQEDSRRKRQREAKRQREEAGALERTAELKRLKNLKRREVKDACASNLAVQRES
jgi:hypothetical protein